MEIDNHKNLASDYPKLAKEWHPTKNGDLLPQIVTSGSGKKVWWVCPIGHEYQQIIKRRTKRGANCPYCSGHRVLVGYNDLATYFPRLAKEWHPTKNGSLTPQDFTCGSGKKVWWVCPNGHEYEATIHDRANRNGKGGTNCPVCNKRHESSFPEQAVYFYVKQLYPSAINKFRGIFEKSMELDVYIPDIRLGIEFDGANWHQTEKEHKREQKKYELCKNNNITLFRIKEHSTERWNDVADCIWYIYKVRKTDELQKVVQAIMDSIDIESNMWTRKTPISHSSITVNIEHDRAEILGYLSKVENSLASMRPDVIDKWDYSKNGTLGPEMFTVSSNQIIWWKCPTCGHEWECSINSMTRPGRYGCLECSKAHRGKSFTRGVVAKVGSLADTNPELAKEWHPTKNGDLTPYDVTEGKFKSVWWLCQACGYEWESSPNNRKKGVGCPCCSGRVPKQGVNDLATLYPDLLREWDYEKNTELDPNNLLPGSGKKAWWICSKCGHNWETIIANRKKGHGCPKCGHAKSKLNGEG